MIRREALWEYLRGALWVLPSASVLAALVAGSTLSLIEVGPESPLAPLLFQGTADDARTLLLGITGTVVTVIALVLGLTVVALQLSSTQFSPRLLRNFLRDRHNQVVLSVFVATFAYSAAGLYTVGVSEGSRTASFPRLAVSGAIGLLFASLGVLVYFAHHLAHSIQVDAIMQVAERNTLAAVRDGLHSDGTDAPAAPDGAVALAGRRSGYVQAVHPRELLPLVDRYGVVLRLRPRVGDHVVAGTTLAWIWPARPGDPAPDPAPFGGALDDAVRVGFERTFEQDAAFGVRQLVDVAAKAMSPAVNDPYTAIQAIDHLSVILSKLASRRLGADIARDSGGAAAVIVPGWRFADYLTLACGTIRRYGAREPTVAIALLRLLATCSDVVGDDPARQAVIDEETRLIVADAERAIGQPADLVPVRAAAESVRRAAARAPTGP
jgi:uncharacterized membrane protein